MRLVYRPDAEGRLHPVLERGVAGYPRTAQRERGGPSPTGERGADDEETREDSGCWLDPDYHQHPAEDWELEPRHSHAPVALVVAADPDARIRMAEVLRAEGYAVVTCPGPGTTRCEASRLGAASRHRCPRVPVGTRLIVLDAAADGTRVGEAYAAWEPEVELSHAP